uniref:G-protein coupled receptors family 1 profile domain-containing protein n=1 Tax=Clytia hemisphaerica TaxID=252671 RepID=A0A7M5WWN2_9CNID
MVSKEDHCLIHYWTRNKDEKINGVLAMATLSTIIFALGIFANLLLAIPILFNRINRQKHFHYFSISFSNILVLAIGVPILMQAFSEKKFNMGDECNGWLPFMFIFFPVKSILDSVIFTIDAYLDILPESRSNRTAEIVIKVSGISISWVLSVFLACYFIWINSNSIIIALIVLFATTFVLELILLTLASKCVNKQLSNVTESNTDVIDPDLDDVIIKLQGQKKYLNRKIIMIFVSAILIGQYLVNLKIWTDQSKYLNDQLFFSIIFGTYNTVAFALLIAWEQRILQKFYYRHCISHRVVVPA